MRIDGVTNTGATPALAAMLSFSAQRHRLITHNVANISTPDFRPTDVSPKRFQEALSDAVDQRRRQTGGEHGGLRFKRTDELQPLSRGGFRVHGTTAGDNVLFHDRNNRDVERMMQDLVENAGVFRTAGELLRTQTDQLRRAISERAG
ncbi:MAG: hypothetical protein AAGG07_01980 [Planctomycetota bacterium]